MDDPAASQSHPRRIAITAASVLALGFACLTAGPQSFGQSPTPASTKPVLVELFTSEGCSDCPPADNLLARLDAEQPIPGAHVIVLSEHVTYWNHDGWTDPFSLEAMDERQNDYVARFHLPDDYTPQAVVDGMQQMVGNDANGLVRAVEQDAALPDKQLTIAQAALDKGSVRFSVQAPDSQGDWLFAALAQDVAHSIVTRGENAGHTLHHVAVVREMKQFKSKFADGRELSVSASNLDRHNGDKAVRLVVFLVDARSGHVVGAAEQHLSLEQNLSQIR